VGKKRETQLHKNLNYWNLDGRRKVNAFTKLRRTGKAKCKKPDQIIKSRTGRRGQRVTSKNFLVTERGRRGRKVYINS